MRSGRPSSVPPAPAALTPPEDTTYQRRARAVPLKTHSDEAPSLNLTPMIDIVFLLIIFFMVGTKVAELERKIGLRIPEVAQSGTLTPAPQKRVVNVFHDGRITLDRHPVTLDELTGQLAHAHSQYRDLGVLVRGDAAGPFQHVAEVLNACKQAGIVDLGISVRLVSHTPHQRRL